MNTRILPADEAGYAEAARLLREGSLVAFPTETVYGLGADAGNPAAVRAIFAVKDRPADNPLIVHIHDRAQLAELCEIPPLAVPLMDAFWPGPLTLLMPRKSAVPDVVTAGLPTVAVRMPAHPVAAALLRACGLPIAAPSANRSGKPSPTTAAHVYDDLAGRIPLILEGGSSDVGLESTVVDPCGSQPIILRPGGITREMLEAALDREVALAGSILQPLQQGEVARSPGMRYRHYAPDGQLTLVTGTEVDVIAALPRLFAQAEAEGLRTCVLCFTEHRDALAACRPHDLGSRNDPAEVARRLFDLLRRLDSEGMQVIFSEVVPAEGVGLAVMNRLGRAASFRTIDAAQVLREADAPRA